MGKMIGLFLFLLIVCGSLSKTLGISCAGEEFYPDPYNCSCYYHCSNEIAYKRECPSNLHWNNEIKQCSYPQDANCIETSTLPTTPTLPTTTCRPVEDSGNPIDPEHPEFTIEPGEDGDCPKPPVTIPVEPGKTIEVTITFNLKMHPLDTYVLMDFSGSMSDDKENLVKLSDELVKACQEMSHDCYLGFGAFVDKPIEPLGSYYDYSFRNVMKLTYQVENFSEKVEATPILSGADTPESAGDALAQSIVCDPIGWRSNTRRLILMATDADFHVAGDGMLVGINETYDGKCHLDQMGHYTKELELDYPSKEQLIELAKEYDVTCIFGVTNDVEPIYTDFAVKMEPAASIGVLNYDSSNIINLYKDEYNKMKSYIEIEKPTGDGLVFNYFTNCENKDEEPHESFWCNNVTDTVTFILKINLEDCPSDSSLWEQNIKIKAKGLPSFQELVLKLMCDNEESNKDRK